MTKQERILQHETDRQRSYELGVRDGKAEVVKKLSEDADQRLANSLGQMADAVAHMVQATGDAITAFSNRRGK